jgi:hypothetical protein
MPCNQYIVDYAHKVDHQSLLSVCCGYMVFYFVFLQTPSASATYGYATVFVISSHKFSCNRAPSFIHSGFSNHRSRAPNSLSASDTLSDRRAKSTQREGEPGVATLCTAEPYLCDIAARVTCLGYCTGAFLSNRTLDYVVC